MVFLWFYAFEAFEELRRALLAASLERRNGEEGLVARPGDLRRWKPLGSDTPNSNWLCEIHMFHMGLDLKMLG